MSALALRCSLDVNRQRGLQCCCCSANWATSPLSPAEGSTCPKADLFQCLLLEADLCFTLQQLEGISQGWQHMVREGMAVGSRAVSHRT